jgi:bifunctional DNase/RNase
MGIKALARTVGDSFMVMKRTIRFSVGAGLCLSTLIWISGETLAESFTSVSLEQKELLQVKVYRLTIDPTSQNPVVFLAESAEEYALPIWIGRFEADAIYSAMHGIKHRRPYTHDLLEKVIQRSYGKVQRIIIPYVSEGIYYATLVMERGGSLVEIDARPSDSIVMALKFKAPIFVSKALFRDLAIPLVEQGGIEELYGLTLQELSPSLALCFSYESTEGVLVSDVRKGSRAEKDGIERGDIFVEVGGQTVDDTTSFKDALGRSKTAVQAKIFRNAQYVSITLHPE